jgi:hypothetical protein
MVGPSTRKAFKSRALELAAWLKNQTSRLRDEMEKQGIEMHLDRRDWLSGPRGETSTSGPTTVTLKAEDIRNLIQGINDYVARMRKYEKW